MGIATFIENDYGTQTAKALVYNAWWFEAIMVFFVINFFWKYFSLSIVEKRKMACITISCIISSHFNWSRDY